MFAIGDKSWPGISKLIEEAGEVQQVCGKLMGSRGSVQHWDGTDLRKRLEEELGDLLAAIRFVMQHAVSPVAVLERADEKFALFERWHQGDTSAFPAPSVEAYK